MTVSNLPVVDINNTEKILEARLPRFDDHRKAEFLVYRSAHFTIEETMKLLDLEYPVVGKWLQSDPVFKEWSGGKQLRELQSRLAEQVLRGRFLRNVFIQLQLDSRVMTKKLFTPEELSGTEEIEARQAGQRYSAANIASMLKVLDGDYSDDSRGDRKIELKVELNGEIVHTYEGRRAASRKLLDDFTEKSVVVDNDTGEVV